MLPYNRELSYPQYDNLQKDYQMIWQKYKTNELPSSTDSVINYGIDSKDTNRWYRYSAYTAENDPLYQAFFSDDNLNWMSVQITNRLKVVHPEGKNIVVPNQTIASVADSYWNKTFLTSETIREMTILYIVNQVTTDFQITQQNDNLDAWVQKYDITTGLRQFNDIRINEKTKTYFYNWNY